MFKVKTYEVTENWLDPVVIPTFGTNREYLTKAAVHNAVYNLLMEHRAKTFNFDINIMYDRVKYTVKVDNESVNLYDGKKLIYEIRGLTPHRFEEFADCLAWKMVSDR